jgi:phenylpropionate dioxygenase-like ring-hydroxylating dioxygenase large terminal subunit
MLLRNCWYMAGWQSDFASTTPTSRTIAGEALVFYRRSNGELVVMEDRCSHRFAPLSRGRVEGDDIRCMYHGLKFGPDGVCNHIPQQSYVSNRIRVRTFPIIERHGAAWIWLGETNKAQSEHVPHFAGPSNYEWSMVPDQIELQANYALLNDNLLDLSHVAFVHRESFGAGDEASATEFSRAEVTTTSLANGGVRVERRMRNATVPPYVRDYLETKRADFYVKSEHLIPGIFLLNTRCYPLGTFDQGEEALSCATPFLAEFSCQAVTPINERATRYFFALGPWSALGDLKQFYLDIGRRAFAEDRAMLEAQQEVIDRSPNARFANLTMDKASAAFRAQMNKLIREEGALHASYEPG